MSHLLGIKEGINKNRICDQRRLPKHWQNQYRVRLSKLNFHKFKHNFRDTLNPLCPTNDGVEDTEHYFLLCNTYDADRRDLLSSVNAILLPHCLISLSNEELLKIILYGHEELPFDSNAKILTATLKYIHVSKRFE